MNVPPNTRPFSLEMAQQNHPLVTRAGKEAKFIAYVPENQEYYKIVCSFDGQFLSVSESGRFYSENEDSCNDLFLAPLGYCEGKPVFAGDELCVKESSLIFKVPVSAKEYDLSLFKWPSKAPVVESKLDVYDVFIERNDGELASLKRVANKAIERAILDGDVVPTSVVKEMLNTLFGSMAYNQESKQDKVGRIINDYLEKL